MRKDMNEIPIIKSKIFSKYKEITFGFSTRHGGVSPEPYGMNLSFNVGDDRLNVLANRERFFGALKIGLDELAIPRQVQGGIIRRVYIQGGYDSCDGLITNSHGVFLVVSTADCLPVFIYDPVAKAVGVVHAGWRGLSMDIIPRAIRMMEGEFKSSPDNLIVFIGPSADVCCYEIQSDVASRFSDTFLKKSDKTFLNMKLITLNQLINSGLKKENIEISQYCTICNPELFHSYRRDKEKSGRMMGVIGLVR